MNKSNFIHSFIQGFGSVLDIFPEPAKNPVADKSVDEQIKENWQSVGNALRDSIKIITNDDSQGNTTNVRK